MKTIYEVKHCGRVKKFDNYEEACKHAKALAKLGYHVTMNMVTNSLYNTLITQIYKSW